MAIPAKSAMSLCRPCRSARAQVRAFSSTPSPMVRPESPKFIEIPRPIQPYYPIKPAVKGVLPVPRELFPPRRPDKPTTAYVEAATPEPSSNKPKLQPGDPQFDYVEWKKRMAAIRRQNLREGLVELYARKQKSDAYRAKRSSAKIAQRERILAQGPREDDRLMQPSTIQVMKPSKMPILPDPNVEQRLEASRLKYASKQQSKRQQRIDSLHSLYMNARNFIINEEQLNAEIERVFPEGENPAWTNDEDVGENIWNLGPPSTIESLVHKGKTQATIWSLGEKRVKKIAEELTGGAI
ncbi:uncharacterized protein PADG_03135 [Paracoccidioides brasiliensis Pb18]|uniref:Uncharacterized protein n=2 Tax=Paracoccidioides brasiliensis TaxID=121759 RepID=C1G7I0_PARBD|nr:uncharacterized protein PADG_03135 [Paracoccidioides brasiliensis Pb18]EEH47037.1 hypothetical protein PADG_03135 [Paracoccidioides brasiliensis Pb18]ODH25757.1 hypothetical protein ACO22_05099 [Paracoccidioides brasiliensis]ODH51471.1 hypothetical protein GX48_02337 [Paracoccidioides brasiliensis]